jgi:hypothetical protein
MPADPSGNDSDAEARSLEDAEREVTPVGGAPQKLLELSSSSDQDTRAYHAPRQLLELARREQTERAQDATTPPEAGEVQSVAPQTLEARGARSDRIDREDAAPPRPIGESQPPREPPAHRPKRSAASSEASAPSISTAPVSSSDSIHALDDRYSRAKPGDDAAPPVARSRPSGAWSDTPGAASASRPQVSLFELAQAMSDSEIPSSLEAPSEVVRAGVRDSDEPSSKSPFSLPKVPWLVLILAGFVALGFALAKWRGLELLLPR